MPAVTPAEVATPVPDEDRVGVDVRRTGTGRPAEQWDQWVVTRLPSSRPASAGGRPRADRGDPPRGRAGRASTDQVRVAAPAPPPPGTISRSGGTVPANSPLAPEVAQVAVRRDGPDRSTCGPGRRRGWRVPPDLVRGPAPHRLAAAKTQPARDARGIAPRRQEDQDGLHALPVLDGRCSMSAMTKIPPFLPSSCSGYRRVETHDRWRKALHARFGSRLPAEGVPGGRPRRGGGRALGAGGRPPLAARRRGLPVRHPARAPGAGAPGRQLRPRRGHRRVPSRRLPAAAGGRARADRRAAQGHRVAVDGAGRRGRAGGGRLVLGLPGSSRSGWSGWTTRPGGR